MNANYEYKTAPVSIQRETKQLTTLPHLHDEIELVYVLKGSTVAYADQSVCEIGEGELYISFPNQIHYYNSQSDCFVMYSQTLNNRHPEDRLCYEVRA